MELQSMFRREHSTERANGHPGPAPAGPFELDGVHRTLKLRWKKALNLNPRSAAGSQTPFPDTILLSSVAQAPKPVIVPNAKASEIQSVPMPKSGSPNADEIYHSDPQPQENPNVDVQIQPVASSGPQAQEPPVVSMKPEQRRQEVLLVSAKEQAAFQNRARILETGLENFVRDVIRQAKRNAKGEPTIFCNSVQNGGGNNEFTPRRHLLQIVIGGDDERHVKTVRTKLANFHGQRLADEGFECTVSYSRELGYVAAGDFSSDTATSETNTVYIDLGSKATSLCGAMIRVESGRDMQASRTMWTCGGLISVDGRLYALSVAHPLRSTNARGTSPARGKRSQQSAKSVPDHSNIPTSSDQVDQQPVSDPSAKAETATADNADRANNEQANEHVFDTHEHGLVEAHYGDLIQETSHLPSAAPSDHSSIHSAKTLPGRNALPRMVFNTHGAGRSKMHYGDFIRRTYYASSDLPKASSIVEIDDAVLSRLWQPLGRIVRTALSDSGSVPMNSDWILIEVDPILLLPNVVTGKERLELDFASLKHLGKRHDGDSCELYTSRGTLEGRVEPGQSSLTIGDAKFRTRRVALDSSLEPGDSGAWVSKGGRLFGVVVARAITDGHANAEPGSATDTTPYIALLIQIEDVFTSISRLCNGARTRLPTASEHGIIDAQRRGREDPHNHEDVRSGLMAELYAQDICSKFLNGLGTGSTPGNQMLEDLHGVEIDLSAFLAVGQAFSLSKSARYAFKWKFRWFSRIWSRLPGKHCTKTTVVLVRRLLQYEPGENFAVLIGALRTTLSKDPRHIWDFINQYLELIGFPALTRPSLDVIAGLCAIFWTRSPRPKQERGMIHHESPANLARLLAMLNCAQKTDSFVVCNGHLGFKEMLIGLTNLVCRNNGVDDDRFWGVKLDEFPRVFFMVTEDDNNSAALVPRSKLYEDLVVQNREPDETYERNRLQTRMSTISWRKQKADPFDVWKVGLDDEANVPFKQNVLRGGVVSAGSR